MFPVLFILSVLKILLFMHNTKVVSNKFLIFFISILVILFVFSLIYLSCKKKKRIYAFSFYLIVSIIIFVDVVYYSYFNTLPSVNMLSQANQLTAVGDSIKSLLTIDKLLLILDLPLLILYLINRRAKKSKNYNRYIKWGVPGGIFLLLAVILIHLSSINLFGSVTNQELFTYHAKDIKKTILNEDNIVDSIALNVEDLKELKGRNKLIHGKYTGVGKNKNLIVIQLEALQNFVINHSYNGQEITPNLNKLIEENGSLYFNNYYQMLGRGNTSDAEFVTNNSLYPSMEEPTYTQYEKNTFYGLPWVLRDNGYTSWVFHGYEKEFWNRENAYVNQGFQRFVSEEDYEFSEDETIGFGIIDEVFYKQNMEYLKKLDNVDDNPFHAFIISLTSHTPFDMPKEYESLSLMKEHKDTILGDYLQSIHYADKALGQFIEDLKKEGYYDNSVIALYGDHFAISSLDKDQQQLMTDYLGYEYDLDDMMNIPLIIHMPNSEANETITTVGSQLDFMPTILNIMGYENEKGIMFGKDLLNYQGENFVAQQTYALKGSVITDEIFLEMSRDGMFENSRVYNMKTKKLLNVNDYKYIYEKAIEEINKSNFILKTDFLKKLK